MKLDFNSFLYMPNFGAKSKDIQKADNIQRRAKQVFPIFSPTYVAEFYNVYGNKHFSKYTDAAKRKMPRIWDTVRTTRALREKAVSNRFFWRKNRTGKQKMFLLLI